MAPGTRLVDLDDVPPDSTLLVTLRNAAGEEVEFVLVRVGGGEVAAWRNVCPHWTDVRFDTGDGATIRDDDLVCGKHGATFDRDSGYCDFGPPEGATLDEAAVAVADGAVHLVDGDYDFVRVGESEAHAGRDRSTNPGERLGF
ncbi:Rieske (2Fe-2S) protein [Halarchaeum nitratireducens]|uniref:(2Fe-2S) ferredoxin n=1 Tax=Halarchaeum nitratireducens TaxID=489913 RepID=A0A830GAF3_9EURY|nr:MULTISPECIES: Rieske 2Fe-2S domain-containing protein [Halarchaeum]MBP2251556.1 nitrite reductase/ring-hydroxylating ferredoxin subunit [Halarchaeum solikamskense]GGN14079.1 (2Fe-2S) ferredoxin [Halarchaeum nitratireducens]